MSSLPKLRLSEFSDSDTYSLHKFDDIFSFSSGKNIKQNESAPEFSTPCVRYGELYHMYGEVITRTINNTNLEHSELTFSAGNEILLPSAGEDPLDIGSASALTLEGVAIGRTINVLRPKGTIDYSHIYVSYYINEKLRKRISQLARGASISNVYNSDLKTLKACLPPFPEQQKIASFLSKVDEKIALLAEKKDKLTEYKKGVMQQLFNGKWEEQEELLTFISPTLRFKADDGSEFPDWEEKTIDQVCIVGTGNKDTQNRADDGLYPFYVRSNTVERINSYSYDGEAILTSGDGVGVGKNYHYVNGKFDYHQRVYCLNEFKTGNNGKYIYYYFSEHFYRRVIRLSAKNSVDSVRRDMITKMVIPAPSLEEQNKIANFLSAIDQKIDLANSELEKAKEWKKGLLQQMFV